MLRGSPAQASMKGVVSLMPALQASGGPSRFAPENTIGPEKIAKSAIFPGPEIEKTAIYFSRNA